MNYTKPAKLNTGDTVLAVTLSRGGPGVCPARYEAGKSQLEQEFGVHVIEGSWTKKPADWIYNHPAARAEDLMNAFKNPNVKAIIATIGGDESIRILPYIDFDIIKNNPKIFMGYSDTTITHFMCQKAGIVSFYGPTIMSGFAENGGTFPYMSESVKKTIFSSEIIGEVFPNTQGWTNEFLSRENPDNQKIKRTLIPNEGRRRIQGSGKHSGKLLGGCIDVLPFMQGTSIWPTLAERQDKILFLEPSEEKMTTTTFERIIRNLGSQGILNVISGILVGRSQLDYTTNIQINYDKVLLKIIDKELGLQKLPIVTNMEFGHTDPMFVLPLGCEAVIDCDNKKFSITENACV